MSSVKKQAVSTLVFMAGFLGTTAVQAENKPAAGGIEEIVVTAQKRTERLQDVPISIGVLGGQDLEKSGARGISDQLNQVGGLNLIDNQPGRDQISIRGASAGGAFGTGSSPVGYYLDEVPFSFIADAIVPDANAFDLDRVEVLRGPQGTLYGASSLNGVVRILTKDANVNDFEVKGRARYGWTESSEDSYSGDLAANVPLVPGKLGLRAVASYANYGGFVSTSTVKDFNDSKIQSYRIKLNAVPTDRLTIKFGVWVSRIDNRGPFDALNGSLTTPFTADQDYRYDYETYNLVLNYDFGPFSLLSSTGYTDLRSAGAIDFQQGIPGFGSIQSKLRDTLDSKVFTQEVRFTSKFSGPWQTTGGTIYRTIDEHLSQAIPDFFVYPAISSNRSESYAAFGEVTRSLFDDKVKLTGGLRYFADNLKTDVASSIVTGPSLLPPRVTSSFHALTWRAVASYYPSRNLTLYASAATGFRSGVNLDASATAFGFSPAANADTLLTYEIGVKGILMGGKLSYELAGYHEKWDKPQQTVFTPIGTTALVNAKSASGFGASASLNARVTERFSLNASGDWNSLEFDADTITSGVVFFPKGSRMNTSPEVTWAFGAEYRVPVFGDRHAFVSGSTRYNSKMIRHDVVNSVATTTSSPNLLYGELRAGIDSDSWSASVFVENVTDERDAITPPPSLFPTQPRLRPRTIGVQASFKY